MPRPLLRVTPEDFRAVVAASREPILGFAVDGRDCPVARVLTALGFSYPVVTSHITSTHIDSYHDSGTTFRNPDWLEELVRAIDTAHLGISHGVETAFVLTTLDEILAAPQQREMEEIR